MYLLDTSIVSYAVRNDPLIELYDSEMQGDDPKFVSVQTIGELLMWAEKRRWGDARIEKLRANTSKYSVLPIDVTTATFYSQLRVGAERAGRPLSAADAWILATARQYELVVLSHDRDMLVAENLGVKIICRA